MFLKIPSDQFTSSGMTYIFLISLAVTSENTDNHRFHHPQTKDLDQMNSGTRGTQTVPLALVSICAFALLSG